MVKRAALIAMAISIILFALSCSDSEKGADNNKNKNLKKFVVKIDWTPSPEYYGFFYAQHKGLYKKIGLDVEIIPGKGAPVVAAELAASAIYAGTTTSDNVLRQISKGASFSLAYPILRFNPCVIVSLKQKGIIDLKDLKGKNIGTNVETSVYQQLSYLINIGKLEKGSFTEIPIGWGGPAQLLAGQVDAFLAYTTNAVVDLEIRGQQIDEIFFGNLGIYTYGLVLLIGSENELLSKGLTLVDSKAFINATVEGYRLGTIRDVHCFIVRQVHC